MRRLFPNSDKAITWRRREKNPQTHFSQHKCVVQLVFVLSASRDNSFFNYRSWKLSFRRREFIVAPFVINPCRNLPWNEAFFATGNDIIGGAVYRKVVSMSRTELWTLSSRLFQISLHHNIRTTSLSRPWPAPKQASELASTTTSHAESTIYIFCHLN